MLVSGNLNGKKNGALEKVTPKSKTNVPAKTEAWARLIKKPVEKLGGRIHTSFFAFGEFDAIAITEFPDNVSAAAIAIAFAGGGAVKSLQTIALMTTAEALEAIKKAGTCGYRSVVAESAAKAAGT